jgi:hypothetical protein
VGVELTFNVKEVKAFLQYCESLQDHDVVLRWIKTGDPILLETKLRHGYHQRGGDGMMHDSEATEADPMHMKLVVATLAESQTQSQQPTPQPPPSQRIATDEPSHSQFGSQQPMTASQSFRQKQSAVAVDHEQGEDYVPQTPPQ